MSNYKLVICEKPDAAKRIASSLGSYEIKTINNIRVFRVKDYLICYASGHLYNLYARDRVYPVFDPVWKPKSARAIMLINAIRELAANAKEFINACDLDQEGEVIAYNILTFACNNAYERSLRARFSALTREEIRRAFANLEPSSKFKGLADAGITRHMLDFIYGINLSRALIDASRNILSIGRVQGPTLAFIIEREIEILTHVPKPYWRIEALLSKDGKEFTAVYESIIDNKMESDKIVSICKDKDGRVKKIDKRLVYLEAPTPFNLLDLQREAYKYFKLPPSKTLAIAEKLYLKALISYPRTSSQKLPALDYKSIISNLSKIKRYREIATPLLSKNSLKPNNGAKDDPAHPAIYPTGEIPKSLSNLEYMIYDLIARRFLATFMDPAMIESMDVAIDIEGYIFKAEGKSIARESWLKFYGSYKEKYLPELRVDDIVNNLSINSIEEFSKPRPRFNASSLLTLMENNRIGTKATRGMIIDTLLKRGYITNNMEPTDLGFAIFEIMSRYMPEILSVSLTREMEERLDGIEERIIKSSTVISDATERLIIVLKRFIDNKRIIGTKLKNIIDKEGLNVKDKNHLT